MSFFAPLRSWRRPSETHLYLGLLQFDDDAGNRFRIRAAHGSSKRSGSRPNAASAALTLSGYHLFWPGIGRPLKCWRKATPYGPFTLIPLGAPPKTPAGYRGHDSWQVNFQRSP